MTEVEANPARTRAGGRAGRAALRAADAHRQGPAFIRRQIPTYELLGEKALLWSSTRPTNSSPRSASSSTTTNSLCNCSATQAHRSTGCQVRRGPSRLCAPPPASSHSTHVTHRGRCRSVATTSCSRRPTDHHYAPPAAATQRSRTSTTRSAACDAVAAPLGRDRLRTTDVRSASVTYGTPTCASRQAFMGSVTPERAADSIELAHRVRQRVPRQQFAILGNVNVNSPLVRTPHDRGPQDVCRANQAAVVVRSFSVAPWAP